MLESAVKSQIVKSIVADGGYARRIEDQYCVGFPDLVIKIKGMPVLFAEVKVVKGLSFGPSPRQFVEMSRMAVAGIAPVMVGWKEDIHYVHGLASKIRIEACVQQNMGETITELLKRWYDDRRQKTGS